MKHGLMPYKDFIEPKPPVIFITNYISLLLGSTLALWNRTLTAILTIITINVLLYSFYLQKIKFVLSLILVTLLTILLLGSTYHDTGLNDAETFGTCFMLLSYALYVISAYNFGYSNIYRLLAGILLGLSILSKEVYLLPTFGLILYMLFINDHEINKRERYKSMISLFTGIFVTMLIFTLYLLYNSALISYIDQIAFNMNYVKNMAVNKGIYPQGLSTIQSLMLTIKILIDDFFSKSNLILVYTLNILCVLYYRNNILLNFNNLLIVLIITIFVSLSAVAVSLGHCFWYHYYVIMIPSIFISSISILNKIIINNNHKLFILIIFVPFIIINNFNDLRFDTLTYTKLSWPRKVWDDNLIRIINKHSSINDYILTLSEPCLYMETNRLNPLPLVSTEDIFIADLPSYESQVSKENIRKKLEINLPKVIYLPIDYMYKHNIILQEYIHPLIIKYKYKKINDQIYILN